MLMLTDLLKLFGSQRQIEQQRYFAIGKIVLKSMDRYKIVTCMIFATLNSFRQNKILFFFTVTYWDTMSRAITQTCGQTL